MINLHERVLLDPKGSNPGPSDHNLEAHLTEPPRLVSNRMNYNKVMLLLINNATNEGLHGYISGFSISSAV